MKQEIIGKIENVSLKKEGETNGRKWQMFSVKINGQEFTAFDWQFKNKIGQEGHFFYEEKTTEKNGKQYVNKTLENLPRPKPNFATKEEIKMLEARIKALEELIYPKIVDKQYDAEMIAKDELNNSDRFNEETEQGGHIEEFPF